MTLVLKRSIRLFCFSLLSLAATSTSWADEVTQKIKEHRQIKLAHRELARPFSYLNQQNKPIGLAIDICEKIIERIQSDLKISSLKTQYVLVNAYTSVKTIKEGGADLECGTTANTEMLRRQVAFSIPYFYSSTKMIVRTSSNLRDWSDLSGKRLTYVNGSKSVQLLRKHTFIDTKKMLIKGEISARVAFDSFANKQVDAFMTDEVSLHYLKAGNAHQQQFFITGSPLGIEAFAIMLPQNAPDLKIIVDNEIARLMTSGEFTQLYNKWLMQETPPHQLNYQLPMNLMLRESLKFPSDKVNN